MVAKNAVINKITTPKFNIEFIPIWKVSPSKSKAYTSRNSAVSNHTMVMGRIIKKPFVIFIDILPLRMKNYNKTLIKKCFS